MILIVGDIHLKENLGYADYIEDRRSQERKRVLSQIVEQADDCDSVVFMGDSLNGRNNPSSVIKEFVAFLKRFGKKDLYILGGNHEKTTDGRSAIDFLREMKTPNWHVITDEVTLIDGMVFCPYFSRQELGMKTNEDASRRLLDLLEGKGEVLFVHHAISGTKVTGGALTDIFDEIVLEKKALSASYKHIFAGHIHQPWKNGNIVITGSVFNNEVGEHQKNIWKFNRANGEVEAIALVGRGIYKIENDIEAIKTVPPESIVKFILTEEKTESEISEIKQLLEFTTGAYLFLERNKRTRTKASKDSVMFDFEPESMLEVYAKERKIDLAKLKRAYNLIK